MSMILDAIKRSKESPEGGGSVPSLDTEHYVAPDEPIWKQVGFKLVLLVAVGVMFIVLAVRYSSDRDGSAPSVIEGGVTTEPASEGKPDHSVAASPGDIVPNGKAQTPSTSVLGTSTQDNGSQLSSGGIRETRPIVIPTATQVTKAGGPNAEELSSLYAAMNEEAGAALDSSTASTAKTEVVPDMLAGAAEVSELSEASEGIEDGTAIDFAEILAQAQKELGVQPLVESGEPLLETLSQQTKDLIPSLIYSEHNYSPNGRSEVVLNGQSLTERQRVGPFTVVEILPDSVILRWRETQFRVRARNSWINM